MRYRVVIQGDVEADELMVARVVLGLRRELEVLGMVGPRSTTVLASLVEQMERPLPPFASPPAHVAEHHEGRLRRSNGARPNA